MQQIRAARAAAALVGSLWLLASGLSLAQAPGTADWPHPGGDAGGGRYSPLADIHRCEETDAEPRNDEKGFVIGPESFHSLTYSAFLYPYIHRFQSCFSAFP